MTPDTSPQTPADGLAETPVDTSWLDSPQRRQLAWIYLRRVVEASRADVLHALWPDGWWNGAGEPAGVEQLAEGLVQRRGPSEALLAATERRYLADPREDEHRARRQGWRLVTPDSDEWPESLTETFVRMGEGGQADDTVRGQAEAPFALWVNGRTRLDEAIRHSVTVVGTRAASRYGQEVCEMLGGGLAARGYTIISGAAEGVDTLAHRQALAHGAPTVAILACGLDVAYPRKNAEFLKQIVASGGLVVSEYAPGTPPARHRFLTRNRLAAAMGQATLVVEAPYRSGALNTLNWAEGMSRPTLAVPGPITAVRSQGCLDRLATGRAQLVRSVEDIQAAIEPLAMQMELGFDAGNAGGGAAAPAGGGAGLMSWQHVAVFDAAGTARDHSGSLADIQEATGMDTKLIVTLARKLEKMGALQREGARWRKVPGVRI